MVHALLLGYIGNQQELMTSIKQVPCNRLCKTRLSLTIVIHLVARLKGIFTFACFAWLCIELWNPR